MHKSGARGSRSPALGAPILAPTRSCLNIRDVCDRLLWFSFPSCQTLIMKVKVKVAQSCRTLCDSTEYTGHGILKARILEWVAMPSSRGSSQPRDGTQVRSALHLDSLPAEPPGKPKNTGVGSLSLLQRIFLTQESNRALLHCRRTLPAEPPGKPKNTGVGSLFLLQRVFLTQESNRALLHCRRILYQLSYQGSPDTDGGAHLFSG